MTRWMWLVLALALAAAWALRYEPLPNASWESGVVWDRWLHRFCIVELFTAKKYCDPSATQAPAR